MVVIPTLLLVVILDGLALLASIVAWRWAAGLFLPWIYRRLWRRYCSQLEDLGEIGPTYEEFCDRFSCEMSDRYGGGHSQEDGT